MGPLKSQASYTLLQRWAMGALIVLFMLDVHAASAQTKPSRPMAEVNGERITAEELERALGIRLAELEEQIYDLKRQQLNALIAQRLIAHEAAKRGVTVAALLNVEVAAKVSPVTEQEANAFYEANKSNLRGEEAIIRQQIRTYLQQQKLAERREVFVGSLRSEAKIVVRLDPPPPARLDVSVAGAPLRGAVDAPVTLVEFSDFRCPFCKQAQATLKQVLERYHGKVRLVYRDFPIERLHPGAQRAAEAARCAQDQGKFWDYHDLLFTQVSQLSADDLRGYAAQVGIETTKFERCLSDGIHKAAVQRDIDEGIRLGITGTPAFFINGRPISGSKPLEAFTRVIDDELARLAPRPREENK